MKSHEKSGLIKTGAWEIAFLISSKDLLVSSLHLKATSFFSRALNGIILSAKFGTNLRMKLIFPRKDCRDFLLTGGRMSFIDWTLSGSMETPLGEATCPNSFPSSIPKTNFLGFSEMSYFLHHSKKILRWERWSFLSLDTTVRSSW